jgi:hypothetical protein
MEQGLIARIWTAIPADAELFRACRNNSDRDKRTGTARAKLFFRRASETGLSVGLTPERAVRDIRPEGLFSLKAGDVRASADPLHLAQDQAEHVEIQGVPVYQEDEEKALRIANHLVRHARDCGGTENISCR